MPSVSFIIVNWNRRNLLGDCLESLRRQTFRNFEIILVDNGSHDGSADYVRNVFPEVRIIQLSYNAGFSIGNNMGIREARGKYIALINNDIRIDGQWLIEMVKAAEGNPSAGMFASHILRPDGTIDSAGCMIYRDGNGMCRNRGKTSLGNTDLYPDFPSGCAAMYRRSMLDQIGLFDERFFMYNEDTELGIRAHLVGWKCLYVPSAIALHLYSQSSSPYSLKKLFHVELNRLRIMAKHFSLAQIAVSIPWTVIRYFRLATRGLAWSE